MDLENVSSYCRAMSNVGIYRKRKPATTGTDRNPHSNATQMLGSDRFKSPQNGKITFNNDYGFLVAQVE